MAFLAQDALHALGFKRLGKEVKISDKAAIHGAELMEIGDYSRVDDFCVLSGRVVLGRNVHIAVFCNVAGGEPGVFFGDFAGLSYGCHVFSQSDDYTGRSMTNPTVPDEFKQEKKAAVRLGRHVIVGACSIVLPGVTLGEGSSVGAMSMVTHDTQPWTVYFGIPARRLKRRLRDLEDLERRYLAGD